MSGEVADCFSCGGKPEYPEKNHSKLARNRQTRTDIPLFRSIGLLHHAKQSSTDKLAGTSEFVFPGI
ncbi:MAG: hypothetical protein ABW185_28920 [Sedimenticola sp.]